MTYQWKEIVVYKESTFSLYRSTDAIPFSVEDYGIEPCMTITGCWKGFIRKFIVADGMLLIKELDVNDRSLHYNDESERIDYIPKLINGVRPKINIAKESFFDFTYKEINYPIEYTGTIIIADDYQERYRKMYGAAGDLWEYNIVHELTFKNGYLIKEVDLSPKMKIIRASVSIFKKSYKIGRLERKLLEDILSPSPNQMIPRTEKKKNIFVKFKGWLQNIYSHPRHNPQVSPTDKDE